MIWENGRDFVMIWESPPRRNRTKGTTMSGAIMRKIPLNASSLYTTVKAFRELVQKEENGRTMSNPSAEDAS